MADYKIFQIGTVDYTSKIKLADYQVSSEDVVETWEDGNYRRHYDKIRTRISGEVHMVLDKSQYEQLLTDLTNAINSTGTWSLGVHVNNRTTTTELTSIAAYVTLETSVVYGHSGYSYKPYGMDVKLSFEGV